MATEVRLLFNKIKCNELTYPAIQVRFSTKTKT